MAKSLCSGTWLPGFKSYNHCLATCKGFKICLWILEHSFHWKKTLIPFPRTMNELSAGIECAGSDIAVFQSLVKKGGTDSALATPSPPFGLVLWEP